MIRGILNIIGYELKKNWKLVLGAILSVYGMKLTLCMINVNPPGVSAGTGLLVSCWVFGFLSVYLFCNTITSEHQNSTIPFLMTRSVPRSSILIGKVLGNMILLAGVAFLASFSMTPGYFIDLKWYPECISTFSSFTWIILSSVFLVTTFSLFISLFCQTTVKAIIISIVGIVLLAMLQSAVFGSEFFYLVHLVWAVIFLTAAYRMFANGDIYSFRHLTSRSAPVLIAGGLIFLALTGGLSIYLDSMEGYGSEDVITEIVQGRFREKTWVNREKDLRFLSVPGVKAHGITSIDGDGKWDHFGKRHSTVLSIAPDASSMLIMENRNLINLHSRGHSSLFVVDPSGARHGLGIFPAHSSDFETVWGKNGELVAIGNPYHRKGSRRSRYRVMHYLDRTVNCLGYLEDMVISKMILLDDGRLLVNGSTDSTGNPGFRLYDFSGLKKNPPSLIREDVTPGRIVPELEGHALLHSGKDSILTARNDRHYLWNISRIGEDTLNAKELVDFKGNALLITSSAWMNFWTGIEINGKDYRTRLNVTRSTEGKTDRYEAVVEGKVLGHDAWNGSCELFAFVVIPAAQLDIDRNIEQAVGSESLRKQVKESGEEVIPPFLWYSYRMKLYEKIQVPVSLYVWDLKNPPRKLTEIQTEFVKMPIRLSWTGKEAISMSMGSMFKTFSVSGLPEK